MTKSTKVANMSGTHMNLMTFPHVASSLPFPQIDLMHINQKKNLKTRLTCLSGGPHFSIGLIRIPLSISLEGPCVPPQQGVVRY